MKSRLPTQIYVLIIAAILLGFLLNQINRETPDVEDSLLEAELIMGIPSIPNLAGWPKELLAELRRVHDGFSIPEERTAALARLGELYFSNGFYGEAVQCFSALTRIQPENARWPYYLGTATRDYQDKSVAIESFEHAMKLDDTYPNIRYALSMVYVDAGHMLDSIVHLEKLAQIEDWEPWAHYGLAKGLMLEEPYNEANEQLEIAISGDSGVREFYSLKEELWTLLGDREMAEEARLQKSRLSYEKEPYDPWVQTLWTSCYDTFRLARLAEAEILEGNQETAHKIGARARLYAASSELDSEK